MKSTLIDIRPLVEVYQDGMDKIAAFMGHHDLTSPLTNGFKQMEALHAIIDDFLSEGKRWCEKGTKFDDYFEQHFPWYYSPAELERVELADFKRQRILNNPTAMAFLEKKYGKDSINGVLGIDQKVTDSEIHWQRQFSRLFHEWVLFPLKEKFLEFNYRQMLNINEWTVEGFLGFRNCVVIRSYGDYRIIQYDLNERAKEPVDLKSAPMGTIDTAHYAVDVLGAHGEAYEEAAPWDIAAQPR